MDLVGRFGSPAGAGARLSWPGAPFSGRLEVPNFMSFAHLILLFEPN